MKGPPKMPDWLTQFLKRTWAALTGVAVFLGLWAIVDAKFPEWSTARVISVTGGIAALTAGAAALTTNVRGRNATKQPPSDPPQTHAPLILGAPRSIGDRFLGRKQDIAAVDTAFMNNRSVVIHGIAGVGKSQIAAEYAQLRHLNGWWVDSSPTVDSTLASDLLLIALGIEASNLTLAQQGERAIQRLNAPRPDYVPNSHLLIVDNAPGPEFINDLSRRVTGPRLLFTTRILANEQMTAAGTITVRLEPPSEDDAIGIVCRRCTAKLDAKSPDLREVARELGNLPLALEFAAVRLGQPGQSVSGLLKELRDAPTTVSAHTLSEFLAQVNIPRGAEPLLAVISSVFSTLSPRTRDAISGFGYVDGNHRVSRDLAEAITETSGTDFDRLIDECREKSVLDRSEASAAFPTGAVALHPLTVSAIAATNEPGSFERIWRLFSSRLNAINTDDPPSMTRESPHFAAWLGACVRVLGKQHPYTLASRNNLAIGYNAVGLYEESVGLGEETLQVMERVLGKEHPDTLSSRNNLAAGYHALGRNEEAVNLWKETLEVRERVLGKEHPDTLGSRNNLAAGYRALGRNEEAVKLDEETLEVRERVLGKEHPGTLASRNNLAAGYCDLGRNEEAVNLWKVTLEVRERVLGKEHPDTLGSRNNLAAGCHALGRNEEAVNLWKVTLEVRERVLGKEHLDTLRSRNNLAIGYRALGRNEEADRLERRDAGGVG